MLGNLVVDDEDDMFILFEELFWILRGLGKRVLLIRVG